MTKRIEVTKDPYNEDDANALKRLLHKLVEEKVIKAREALVVIWTLVG